MVKEEGQRRKERRRNGNKNKGTTQQKGSQKRRLHGGINLDTLRTEPPNKQEKVDVSNSGADFWLLATKIFLPFLE